MPEACPYVFGSLPCVKVAGHRGEHAGPPAKWERLAAGSPPPTPAPTREPLADAPGRLRTLADWLDMAPRFGDMQGDEVQQDLRRYAEYIEALLSTPPAPTDPRPALHDALTRIVGDIGPIADESSRRTAAHMLRHYGAQAQPT